MVEDEFATANGFQGLRYRFMRRLGKLGDGIVPEDSADDRGTLQRLALRLWQVV